MHLKTCSLSLFSCLARAVQSLYRDERCSSLQPIRAVFMAALPLLARGLLTDFTASLKHCSHWSCLVSSSGLAASQWAMVNIFIIFFPLPLPPLPLGLRPRPRPLPPPALVAFLTYSMPYFHDARPHRSPEVNFCSESPSASFKHLS